MDPQIEYRVQKPVDLRFGHAGILPQLVVSARAHPHGRHLEARATEGAIDQFRRPCLFRNQGNNLH